MHLNNYENRHDILIDWILRAIPKGAAILDIGANDGSFCPEVARIAAHAGLFAGVDPDVEKLNRNPLVQARYPGTLEDASIPDASFDCAYSIYVFEHVANERKFLEAASRVLKPGGSLFFITPNGTHYFAALASIFANMGIQKQVLKLIRPDQLVDRYHYPALYRLNHPSRLRKLGGEFGFDALEFGYSEKFEEFACYFPGPLKAFPWLWEKGVEAIGQEKLLGNLMGRMIKAA